MCSLGHHEDRPSRRHADGTFTAMVRKIPRAELAERRAAKIAQLREEIAAAEADAIAAGFGIPMDLERADVAELPMFGDEPEDKASRKQARNNAFHRHGAIE